MYINLEEIYFFMPHIFTRHFFNFSTYWRVLLMCTDLSWVKKVSEGTPPINQKWQKWMVNPGNFFEGIVFTFQFLNNKIHNHIGFLTYKLSITNWAKLIFSLVLRGREGKNQIFRTKVSSPQIFVTYFL